MVQESILEIFHDSFERCRERDDFFTLFYQRFLASSEEVEALFKDVDLERVKKMVKDALFLKLMASDGSSFGARKLRDLGKLHSQIGIKLDHYDLWLESLLSVVEETDPRYSTEVDQAWRAVMGIGIEIMKEVSEEAAA